MTTRRASHAGSWYSVDPATLDRELDTWLHAVPLSTEDEVPIPVRHARAIIAPHAGYSYSGDTAAYAYKCVDTTQIKRVFILGPSHHVYMSGCAVTECTRYETPLGMLSVDTEVVNALKETGQFESMSLDVDEKEHSIEMHLPYIYKIMSGKQEQYTIVPILVGALNRLREEFYGKLLAPYLADPENLFIISSDFCHWGKRFSYTFYTVADPPSQAPSTASQFPVYTVPIHSCIERLDREGMQLIEALEPRNFHSYLKRSRNTICGRHPIAVLLWALSQLQHPATAAGSTGTTPRASITEQTLSETTRTPAAQEMRAAVAALLAGNPQKSTTGSAATAVGAHSDIPRIRFMRYAQSHRVRQPTDSSVSYASAYVYLPPGLWAPRMPLPSAIQAPP